MAAPSGGDGTLLETFPAYKDDFLVENYKAAGVVPAVTFIPLGLYDRDMAIDSAWLRYSAVAAASTTAFLVKASNGDDPTSIFTPISTNAIDLTQAANTEYAFTIDKTQNLVRTGELVGILFNQAHSTLAGLVASFRARSRLIGT